MTSVINSFLCRFSALRPDRDVRDLLERAGFTGAELELLARHGRVLCFPEGASLTRVGGFERRLLLLLDGTVRASRLDGEGAVLDGSFAEPEIIGEISVFGSRHYQVADVVATSDVVTTVVFPLSSCRMLEAGAPRLMELVSERSAPRLRSLEAAAESRRAEVRERLGVYFEALDRVRN
jgi:hypothetical protein